jgi:hypothetical protein
MGCAMLPAGTDSSRYSAASGARVRRRASSERWPKVALMSEVPAMGGGAESQSAESRKRRTLCTPGRTVAGTPLSTTTVSSVINAAPARISAKASVDLPFPFGARNATAPSAMATALPCNDSQPSACNARASTRPSTSSRPASTSAATGRCHRISRPPALTSNTPVSSYTRRKPAGVA